MTKLPTTPPKRKKSNQNHQPKIKMKNRIQKFCLLLPLFFQRFKKIPPARPAGIQFANISEGTFEHGVKTYFGDATTSSRYLLYKQGSDADHVAVCGAGDVPLGPSDDMIDDTGVPIAVKLLGAAKGTMRVVSDGTIANGDRVTTGANGKAAKQATTGNLSFGKAVISSDMTAADGDVITIIPALPAKYAF